MTAPAIRAHALTKQYDNHTVVRNLDLEIASGEIFGYLGPNGSGKSTTIKMLCGLIEPTSGDASICGFDIGRQGDAIRHTIGYMSQAFSLYGDLTVEENLEFYGRAYGLDRQQRRKRNADVITFSNLEPYRRQLASTLSGGWKQRLALAAALLHEPRVLFLDEPTAGIDPVARRELWDLLFQLSQNDVTLFVTTHYMDEAERCARVGYIYDGDLIAAGTREELKRLPGVTPPDAKRYRASNGDSLALLASARKQSYVLDATIFGDEVHLVIASDVAIGQIASDLGVEASKVQGAEPTLEDVFVALTQARHHR